MTRRMARQRILAAATNIRAELHRARAARSEVDLDAVAPYRMRHLQQAVCVVRRRQRISAETLLAAGFNAADRRQAS